MNNRKQELANALRDQFLELESQVATNVQEEFNAAIIYLETDEFEQEDYLKYDLLQSCVDDFNTMHALYVQKIYNL